MLFDIERDDQGYLGFFTATHRRRTYLDVFDMQNRVILSRSICETNHHDHTLENHSDLYQVPIGHGNNTSLLVIGQREAIIQNLRVYVAIYPTVHGTNRPISNRRIDTYRCRAWLVELVQLGDVGIPPPPMWTR